MKKQVRFSPEVQERAVRMVVEAQGQHDSQWAAIESISAKIGCTAETLRRWVRQHERDTGQREGLTTAEAQRIKELERENRGLRKANEILKLASAFFAQAELDRERLAFPPCVGRDAFRRWRPPILGGHLCIPIAPVAASTVPSSRRRSWPSAGSPALRSRRWPSRTA